MRFWFGIATIFYGMLGLAVTLVMLGLDYFTDATITPRSAGVVLSVTAALPIPAMVTLSAFRLTVPRVLGDAGRRFNRRAAAVGVAGGVAVLVPIVLLLSRLAADLPGESSGSLAVVALLAGGPLLALMVIAIVQIWQLMRGV